jgi:hypothetical protein
MEGKIIKNSRLILNGAVQGCIYKRDVVAHGLNGTTRGNHSFSAHFSHGSPSLVLSSTCRYAAMPFWIVRVDFSLIYVRGVLDFSLINVRGLISLSLKG